MNSEGKKNREVRILGIMKRFPNVYRTSSQWLIFINHALTPMYRIRNAPLLTRILKGLKSKKKIKKFGNSYCYKRKVTGMSVISAGNLSSLPLFP